MSPLLIPSNHSYILPPSVDSTMLSAFRSCPTKFLQEFCLGLRPPGTSPDLHAGACFATGIEITSKAVHLDGLPLSSALERAFAAFTLAWGDYVPPSNNPKTHDRMWDAVVEYFDAFPPDKDKVQPFFMEGLPTFEFTFAIPLEPTVPPDRKLSEDRWGYQSYDPTVHAGAFPFHPSGDPFLYSGRFDLLGLLEGTIPVVRDEKTSKQLPANWSEQWDLRSQFIGYTWACRQLGIDLDTCVARGVIITKTMATRFPEAIKQYPNHLRERWHEQLRRDLWRIRKMNDEMSFDIDYSEACNAYGGCIFRPACTSLSPEKWWDNYEVRRWNPLEKEHA